MKSSFALLAFTLFVAAAAEAQYCAKCYSPPDGWGDPPHCGITTGNGAETCENVQGYICHLRGTCSGSGTSCEHDWRCPAEKWADGSRLTERARWIVATVEIRQPARARAKS